MTARAPKSYPEVWQRQTPRAMLLQWLWLVGTAMAVVWSLSALDIEWEYLKDAHVQAGDLI